MLSEILWGGFDADRADFDERIAAFCSELMLDEQPVETTLYSLDEDAPSRTQRRTDERHLSLLRVGTLMIGDRSELCLIKNVSAGGMLVRIYSPIEVGTRLSIELKQGEPVSGTARWLKDDCVGVSFDERVDVLDLISTSGEGPRPRMPRIEVDCFASVREDGTVHRARAENISQGGLKVSCSSEIGVGAEVIVTLLGLPPAPAIVAWRQGAAYGITFNRPLALSLLVDWLRERQPPRRAAG